jgi:repressor LexA
MGNKFINIKERVLYLAEIQEGNKQVFFNKIGMTYGNFTGKAKETPLNSNAVENILLNYPNTNPNWLITGKGPILLEAEENNPSILREPVDVYNQKKGIPLLPIEAMAGVFKGDIQVMDYECEYIYIPMFKDASFYIPVLGDSMYPTYNNGDVVACRQLESWTFFQPGRVYVIYTSQGVIVKRVKQGSADDSILIISDNDNYPPFELPKKEILGVALVIGGLWLE